MCVSSYGLLSTTAVIYATFIFADGTAFFQNLFQFITTHNKKQFVCFGTNIHRNKDSRVTGLIIGKNGTFHPVARKVKHLFQGMLKNIQIYLFCIME